MSQSHDDPRVTAYVFGELSPDQLVVFEQELEGSAELRQEVAAVQDALVALRSEFDSHSSGVSPQQRQVIEAAIQQRSQNPTSHVASAAAEGGTWLENRAAILAVLAASVLLAAGLTFPYWKSQDDPAISMTDTLSGGPNKEETARAEPGQAMEEEEASGGKASPDEWVANERALGESPSTETAPADATSTQSPALRELAEMDREQADELPSVAAMRRSSKVVEGTTEPQAAPGMESADKGLIIDRFSLQDAESVVEAGAGFGGQRGDRGEAAVASRGGLRSASDGPGAPANRDHRGAIAFGGDGLGNANEGMMELSPSSAEERLAGGNRSNARSKPASRNAPSPFGETPTDESESVRAQISPAVTAPAAAAAPAAPAGTAPSKRRRLRQSESLDLDAGTANELRSDKEVQFEELSTLSSDETVPDLDLPTMDASGDRYARIHDNPFVEVSQNPLSTFSIDVDTASYGKIRSLLRNNLLPSPDAVRIEELLNYFDYDYPGPQDSHPFAASMAIATCPWNPDHRLARIGIQAKELETQRPSSNLVFLLDVSGSMNEPDKLPLVIEGMKLLTDQLTENDKVAIVVYAGAAGVVLDATRGDKKQQITAALDRLQAGGSTNGGQGIVLAYQIARDHFINGGTNRVILCSDGDFNVGVTGTDEIAQIARENARSNIFLSVLGFGTGNHNDEMMEKLSNDGNGNYAFIDSKQEAKKVFVDELGGTLVTVAKDVKIQIEFNPQQVGSYRLIGYENRMLQTEDFADDRKDAGEIGAGHTVTALYELVPAGSDPGVSAVAQNLRYQAPTQLTDRAASDEVLNLKLRYKQPEGETSTLIEFPVLDEGKSFQQSDRDFQLATAVAGFGMLLRESPHRGNLTFADVVAIASECAKGDDYGYRTEFVELVQKAKSLRGE